MATDEIVKIVRFLFSLAHTRVHSIAMEFTRSIGIASFLKQQCSIQHIIIYSCATLLKPTKKKKKM